jgi:hypothetical protein
LLVKTPRLGATLLFRTVVFWIVLMGTALALFAILKEPLFHAVDGPAR